MSVKSNPSHQAFHTLQSHQSLAQDIQFNDPYKNFVESSVLPQLKIPRKSVLQKQNQLADMAKTLRSRSSMTIQNNSFEEEDDQSLERQSSTRPRHFKRPIRLDSDKDQSADEYTLPKDDATSFRENKSNIASLFDSEAQHHRFLNAKIKIRNPVVRPKVNKGVKKVVTTYQQTSEVNNSSRHDEKHHISETSQMHLDLTSAVKCESPQDLVNSAKSNNHDVQEKSVKIKEDGASKSVAGTARQSQKEEADSQG